ncbi:MAG: helix-turn-helix domain-containing protein [Anaerolineae bacterium]|nr:helix-turn-helix domain-containing protein [Anaerolineae bacterium]
MTDDSTPSNGSQDDQVPGNNIPTGKQQNTNLQTVGNNLLEGLGQLANYFGFNKVMGQLFGALLLSPDPMSLDDLMERLGISKASVSTHMRTLEHMGVVREVWVKDDRRKYYRAENDLWQMLSNVLSSRELRDVNRALAVLEGNAATLQTALSTMPDSDRFLAEFYIERIDQLQEFFRLAQMVLLSLIQQAQQRPDMGDIKRIDFE